MQILLVPSSCGDSAFVTKWDAIPAHLEFIISGLFVPVVGLVLLSHIHHLVYGCQSGSVNSLKSLHLVQRRAWHFAVSSQEDKTGLVTKCDAVSNGTSIWRWRVSKFEVLVVFSNFSASIRGWSAISARSRSKEEATATSLKAQAH
jgi:hypothetical protein